MPADRRACAALWSWTLALGCLLGLLGALLTNPAQADTRLDERTAAVPLYGHVDYLLDPRDEWALDDVLDASAPWRPSSERRDLGFGYVSGPVWLRMRVVSHAQTTHSWRLELDYASLDDVRLYDVGADGVRESQGGDTLPYAQRSISHRTPVFEITLAPGERRTLYLRVSSQGSMTLSGSLMNLADFERHSQVSYIAHALYCGVLVALGLYNLLLFLALRERPYLNYVLFMIAFAFSVLSLNGLGAQYVWPQAVPWSNRILPISLTLAALLAMIFARSFLDTRQWLPRLDRVLIALSCAAALALLGTMLLPVQNALQTMSLTGLLVTLTLLISSFVCVGYKVPGARLFALAWMMLLSGAVLLALRNFALIPSNFMTLYAMQIGSGLEMILLSFALAARFNELKRQKEAALQLNEKVLAQRVAERTEALETANRRLRDMALQDPLTGLANRTALQQQLEQALARSQRSGQLLAVMLIDLDGFKPINDQYGHAFGDRVLAQVAERLRYALRESDLPARLGGDEFVLVCETVLSPELATQLAQRVLQVLGESMSLEGQAISLGASIGIALSLGQEDATELIRRADAAMYRAKAAGRNRIELAPLPD
ncbi:diguanylate cyclase (GGDEF) domain-containing protein [Pseudomonas cuatrocienegasensis]|uniref:Diguanylate cyclase (GGDEF) domain-containing protein n=1 Tax=Pseudomonas cuatrocienegasensis TaxID=543360 RepID=A0ABY1BIC7_9PSED|nr:MULTISPECIES: diguanylate cyclase [Pseudomonas]OEC33382.1 diguanylate cyclase [Pseudomonas sp. 21C1]SEQ94231.1 diguanylate cyclase (GGDEF) domain-containing protein [Pseudomonas cuatrocienegasensis]